MKPSPSPRPVQPREFGFKKRRVAERGGHQQKARLRQRQQWHLPGHPAFAVGVVVKFVHHHVTHVGLGALAQGNVCQDFRRAAEDGRIAVHRGVAGAQADIIRAEITAEREEFFIHQRLDGAGVNRAATFGDCLKMQRGGHERFAGAGRRVEDDVFVLEQFENGVFLRRIKLELPAQDIIEKALEQQIVAGPLVAGNEVVQGGGHKRFNHGRRKFRRPKSEIRKKSEARQPGNRFSARTSNAECASGGHRSS